MARSPAMNGISRNWGPETLGNTWRRALRQPALRTRCVPPGEPVGSSPGSSSSQASQKHRTNPTHPPSTACRESSVLYQAADGTELPLLVFDPGEDLRPRAGTWRRAESSQSRPGTGCSLVALPASTTALLMFDARSSSSRGWPRCAGSKHSSWPRVAVRQVLISRLLPR